jgi:hypothetical protein
MFRIVIGSLLGGFLMFMGGAFSHMGLELETAAMIDLPGETEFKTLVADQKVAPGMYSFPGMNMNLSSLSPEEQAKAMERYEEQYRQGPAGILIIAPTGEASMSSKQLILEFVANLGAAFVACLFLYNLNPNIGFIGRWLLIVAIAPASWLTLTFSHWLWYRFPMGFVVDGLTCALIEWAIAGVVIAAWVRPSVAAPSQESIA